jgi:DME family drug/metabolite transporter
MAAHNQTEHSRRLTKGYLIAFIATIIWSSTGVLIRYLTSERLMPPIVLAFWRDLIVSLFLFAILRLFQPRLLRLQKKELGFFIFYGLILACFNSSWTISVYFNGAAVSTVLAYSSGAFTAIMGKFFFQERLNWAKMLAVGLSLGGCILVSGAHNPAAWKMNPVGISLGLFSGVAFAAYTLMGRHAARQSISSLTSLVYSFGFAAVFIFLLNLVRIPGFSGVQDLFWLGSSISGWAFLIFLAIGPTIGGYGLYSVSLGYLPASVANLIATLEPAFTTVQAYIFLNERMTGIQVAGSGLILVGVLFLRWYEGRMVQKR